MCRADDAIVRSAEPDRTADAETTTFSPLWCVILPSDPAAIVVLNALSRSGFTWNTGYVVDEFDDSDLQLIRLSAAPPPFSKKSRSKTDFTSTPLPRGNSEDGSTADSPAESSTPRATALPLGDGPEYELVQYTTPTEACYGFGGWLGLDIDFGPPAETAEEHKSALLS